MVFFRFFAGRLFFERVGALERKSMGKSQKLIARVAQIDEKARQDLANSLTKHQIWRTWTKLDAGNAPRVPKTRPRAVQERLKSAQERPKSAQERHKDGG